jgi:cyclophilin family peptidyl-prolyl cis-trans isomerase
MIRWLLLSPLLVLGVATVIQGFSASNVALRFAGPRTSFHETQSTDLNDDNVVYNNDDVDNVMGLLSSRRAWLQKGVATASGIVMACTLAPLPSLADSLSSSSSSSAAAQVTDKVYMEIKGLPGPDGSVQTGELKRVVIGLFGSEAPQSVDKIKKLMSAKGLPAPCKPREERLLQREQLEANKVFNSCTEGQDKGVNYDYASIWRIIQGERIDVGAVAGRFVARESPEWQEAQPVTLTHDRPGIVSVRKGSDSGFGFTIYPGGGGEGGGRAAKELDEDHIVVGQILEGMDVIQQLDATPVITSAKVNYMGLVGGPTTKSAPSRSCRYGGDMYCNENKPLIKLTIYKTGIV